MSTCPFCFEDRKSGSSDFLKVHGIEQVISIPQITMGMLVLQDLCPLFYPKVLDHYLLVSVEHFACATAYPDQAELAFNCFALINFLQRKYPNTDVLTFEHGAHKGEGPCGIRHLHIHFVVVRKVPSEMFGQQALWILAERGKDFSHFQLVETPLWVNLNRTVGEHGYLHFGIVGKRSTTLIEINREHPLPSQLPRNVLAAIQGKSFFNWRDYLDGLVPNQVIRGVTNGIKKSRVIPYY